MTQQTNSAGDEVLGRIIRIAALLSLLLLFAAAVLSYTPADAPVLYGGVEGHESNLIGWAGAVVSHLLFLHLGLGTYLLLILVVVRFCRLGVGELNPDYRSFHHWQGFWAGGLILFGSLLLFGLVPEMFDEVLPSLGLGHKEGIKSGLSGGVTGQFFSAPRTAETPDGILRHFIGNMGCAIVGLTLLFGGLVWLYLAEWKEFVAGAFRREAGEGYSPREYETSETSVEENPRFPFLNRSRTSEVDTAPAAPAPAVKAVPPAPVEVEVEEEDDEEEFEEVDEVEEVEEVKEPSVSASNKAVSDDDLFEDDDEDDEPENPFGNTSSASSSSARTPAAAQTVTASPSVRSNEVQTVITRQGSNAVAFQNEYVLPPLSMLSQGNDSCGEDLEEISAAKNALEQTLEDFGIRGWVSDHTSGPRVTRFEITLEPGVNVRKVEQIADNIAMNLAAQSVRILAPIPGRPVVGVEISNSKASAVFMRSVMESPEWRSGKAEIPIALGKDVSGKPVVLDIASAPHMLIAGSTGTGKSVCSNSLIMSLLFRFRPEELKLIMVDPKVVEFDVYKNLPHLLTPVINDSAKVPVALRWAVNEMEKRYRILAAARVKKISEFNSRPIPEEPVFDDEGVQIPDRMPVLLVIIDELGDLMMTEAKKDVENSITRIAQKGRAAGVHVVVATQRPSTNVITGVIKANLPTRLCFQVRSLVDSRVVLDSPGGEKLLGKGDMLYMSPSSMHIERVQGSFVPDSDIQKVVDFVSAQAPQQFNSAVLAEEDPEEAEDDEFDDDDGDVPWDDGKADASALVKKYLRPGDPDVMRQALEVVILERKASTSYLQRRLGIGYNRAAELIDQMEARGIVGPPSGSGNKRDILVFDGLDIKE